MSSKAAVAPKPRPYALRKAHTPRTLLGHPDYKRLEAKGETLQMRHFDQSLEESVVRAGFKDNEVMARNQPEVA
jgi:hypothetical protein